MVGRLCDFLVIRVILGELWHFDFDMFEIFRLLVNLANLRYVDMRFNEFCQEYDVL